MLGDPLWADARAAQAPLRWGWISASKGLIQPRARAVETACKARGDALCRFELRW